MSKEEILTSLGEKFRKARERQGLSQTELAYRVGKDQPSINRLEMGNINPSYIYLIEVAEGLELSLLDVLKDS